MLEYVKSILDYIYLRHYGVDTKFGYVRLKGLPIIRRAPESVIKIGKGVTLVSKSKYNVAGVNHPIILATLSNAARIEIEDGSGLSGCAIVAVKSIRIGKDCGLGANVNVYDTDFHPVNPAERKNQATINDAVAKPVIIEDSVWVGGGSTVLKGVKLGCGAVIGAMSLVTKDVPKYEIWGGNPIHFIRKVM